MKIAVTSKYPKGPKKICMSHPDAPTECLQDKCPSYCNGRCVDILTAADMFITEAEMQKRFSDIPTVADVLRKAQMFEMIRENAPNEDAGDALCECIESGHSLVPCQFCDYSFRDYGYIPCGEYCPFCNIDYRYYPDMPLSIVSLAERGIKLIPHL